MVAAAVDVALAAAPAIVAAAFTVSVVCIVVIVVITADSFRSCVHMNTNSSMLGMGSVKVFCCLMYQLRSITTSKRIELESPGWSGLVENSKPDKT